MSLVTMCLRRVLLIIVCHDYCGNDSDCVLSLQCVGKTGIAKCDDNEGPIYLCNERF